MHKKIKHSADPKKWFATSCFHLLSWQIGRSFVTLTESVE